MREIKKGGEAENESNVAQNKNYFYQQGAERLIQFNSHISEKRKNLMHLRSFYRGVQCLFKIYHLGQRTPCSKQYRA